jgi:hypothetical protein
MVSAIAAAFQVIFFGTQLTVDQRDDAICIQVNGAAPDIHTCSSKSVAFDGNSLGAMNTTCSSG